MGWDLVDEIFKRDNDPSDSIAGLSKLTSILPSTAWGYENKWALSAFTPFLSIKSVRNFCVGSPIAIDDGYTGCVYVPKQEIFGEKLEVVQMAGGVVDHIEVRKFLSRTPRLRSFAFNFECKWHGCGSDWDARAFVAAVEDEVSDTLEKLSLTIVWVLDGTTGIKSMKKFRS